MSPQEEAFWQRVLELSQKKFTPKTYEYFILDARLISVQNHLALIQLPQIKKLFWQGNTEDIILTAGFEVFGEEITANFSTADQYDDVEFNDQTVTSAMVSEPAPLVQKKLPTNPETTNLQQKYSFANFITGEGNKQAFSAALAVAESPGTTYNPLFIWGGPGLGKTHLLNAIGNEVLANNPTARIKYITTEEFVNRFVTSTRNNTMEELKEEFRQQDVLLIDDIQSLKGKTGTQEEFFNTFNALHGADKQIVLTSDREPKQLNDLEQRLVSRFAWGLTMHISPPEYETRVAILQEKLQSYPFELSPEAMEYLANQISTNVRELEGALKNINLLALQEGINLVDVDTAAKALKSLFPETIKVSVISIATIQEQVSKFYGLTTKDLKGPVRAQNIALARQVAMYLAKTLTDYSLQKIGKEFGGRDHSTVHHSYNKIKAALKTDIDLKQDVDTIQQALK